MVFTFSTVTFHGAGKYGVRRGILPQPVKNNVTVLHSVSAADRAVSSAGCGAVWTGAHNAAVLSVPDGHVRSVGDRHAAQLQKS